MNSFSELDAKFDCYISSITFQSSYLRWRAAVIHKILAQPVLSVYYIFCFLETLWEYFIDGYQCLENGFDGWEADRTQDPSNIQTSI